MNWKRAKRSSMKKFVLRWGRGNVEDIQIVYKTITVDAENIDEINPTVTLPDIIKRKIFYVRTIFTSETKRNYDYGSWSEFIEAEEIKNFDAFASKSIDLLVPPTYWLQINCSANWAKAANKMVGVTGIEPVTSSVWRKRSPAEPNTRGYEYYRISSSKGRFSPETPCFSWKRSDNVV